LTSKSVAGLTIRKSATGCEQTDIYIDVKQETIFVDRTHSSLYSQFNNATEQGKFRLWNVNGVLQTLDLHIYVDNSIVEIYANGVFCLTTRIYPTLDDSNEIGVLVKEGNEGNIGYGTMWIWDGLDSAWPQRPADTSVPLVWDNADVTQNGTLWAGN
jgi:beta-fructofuranosidase